MKNNQILGVGVFFVGVLTIGILSRGGGTARGVMYAAAQTRRPEIIRCPGDGNCLFSSIGFHVSKPHTVVRREIVDELRRGRERYVPFFTPKPTQPIRNRGQPGRDDLDTSHKSYDTYVDEMSRGGVWGGEMELSAAASIYKRPVIVRQSGGAYVYGDAYKNKTPIELLYNGSSHYDAIKRF